MFGYLENLRRSGRGLVFTVLAMSSLLTACGGGGGDDGGSDIPVTTTDYRVEFAPKMVIGATDVPETVSASASISSQQGDGIYAAGNVMVSGTTATAVTINAGYAGENGPVVITLNNAGGDTWNVPETELDFDDLYRLDAAGYYISIQSPDGELRGQIVPQDWIATIIDLDADNVVPSSTSTGAAKAGLSFHSSTGTYRIRMTVSGVSEDINATVRNAIAGARGDVVINLEQSATDPNIWGSRDINNINADDFFTQTGLNLLASGALYFGINSVTNMNGDLRGQIIDDTIDVFDIELSTAQIVGSPVISDATGVATVTWVESLSRFGVAVNTDITNALGVYAHQGAPGTDGPALFTLTPDPMLSGSWVLAPTDLTADEITAFMNNNFYITVQTAAYPSGELRGQLDPDTSGRIATRSVGANGGKLTVTDENGTNYVLTISPDGLFDETVDITMSVAEGPIDLPAGLTPIVAVQLDPAGTTFADYPVLEIDGPLPAGAKIAFVANDDFSVIEYRPLQGNDAITASLATDGAAFDIPHFSVAGVASVDNGCVLPEAIPGNTAEAIATTAILDHVAHIACLQMLGVEATVDSDFVSQQLEPWFTDLVARTLDPSVQQLQTFGELLFETGRYLSLSQQVGLEISVNNNAAIRNLLDVFTARVMAFDSACLSGETSRTEDFLRWLGEIKNAPRPSDWTRPIVSCLVTARVTPEGPQAVVRDSTPITYEPVVTGADGRDLSLSPVLSLGWYASDGLRMSDISLEFDTSNIGLREARVSSSYFRFAEPAYARNIVVDNHVGVNQLSSSGSASGCADPEDDGSSSYFLPGFTVTSQSAVASSDTSATVSISGTGGNGVVTVTNLTVTIVYDNNTETSLGGTATGSLSFTQSGIDDETGEPYMTTGNLNLGSTSVAITASGTGTSAAMNFQNASGSDSAGCTLQGSVQLSGK